MALLAKAPKGTHDILPSEVRKWQYVEDTAMDLAEIYGFQEIRTPNIEDINLFVRSVGDTSDVVQKEMYEFEDKGGRHLALKPEGTAGAVRACLENGLLNESLPVRVCYNGRNYRYERPQSGRYREFNQFGVEMFGSSEPSADAEIIDLMNSILEHLQIEEYHLEINSIGCPECRKEYHKALTEYYSSNKDQLCKTCLERLDKNPMRLLDCKEENCKKLAENAPKTIDYLCDDCKAHFEKLKKYLDDMEIKYSVNPQIVRGLDYYTKTVFEFVCDKIGAQGTICGGGRYDGLVEQLGGKSVPAIGFAIGLERLIMLMESCGASFPEPPECEIYIAPMGEKAQDMAILLTHELRKRTFFAQTDTVGRSIKAQMKYADKIGAKYTLAIGDNEIENGVATIKNMANGVQNEISLGENFVDEFYDILVHDEEMEHRFGEHKCEEDCDCGCHHEH